MPQTSLDLCASLRLHALNSALSTSAVFFDGRTSEALLVVLDGALACASAEDGALHMDAVWSTKYRGLSWTSLRSNVLNAGA